MVAANAARVRPRADHRPYIDLFNAYINAGRSQADSSFEGGGDIGPVDAPHDDDIPF